MEFTQEKTNIAKGVAICLMFAHHLFAFPERLIGDNSYIPILPFIDAESYIGRFGSISVSIFLFLSGYGMYLSYLGCKKKLPYYILSKLKQFYLTYWLYFLIFAPVGLLYFNTVTFWNSNKIRYSADTATFIQNFIGWDSDYNGEWWFVKTFIITLIFLFPFYVSLIDRNIFAIIFVSLFLFSFSSKINIYGDFGFIFWQTSFAVGIICAKFKFFTSQVIHKFEQTRNFWILAWLLLCFMLRIELEHASIDFLLAPFFIYLSLRAVLMVRASLFFELLGKQSFPLWLSHSFFCYYYFQGFVYASKSSPIIFLLLLAMTLLSVLGIQALCFYIPRAVLQKL